MFPAPMPEFKPNEELIPTEKPDHTHVARHSWFDRTMATAILVLMFIAFAVMVGMLMGV